MLDILKGWRTLLFNSVLLAGPIILEAASGFDWSQWVPAKDGIIIVTVVNIFLRMITTTRVGTK